MAAIIVKTGSWLYDGDHVSRVEVFKESVWTPLPSPPDDPDRPPPRDAHGYFYYARYTVTGGGVGQTRAFASVEEATNAVEKLLPSTIKWDA